MFQVFLDFIQVKSAFFLLDVVSFILPEPDWKMDAVAVDWVCLTK